MNSATSTVIRRPSRVNVTVQRRLRVENRFVLGVRYDDLDQGTALSLVERYIRNRSAGPARSVFFTNVHSIHVALRDPELRRAINYADLVLPDGSGLALAGRLLKPPMRENLNGTDFVPKLLERAQVHGWSVYLLGATWKSVLSCVDELRSRYPGLNIAGCHDGYLTEDDNSLVLQEVNRRSPDILLVAMGTPQQELWITEHLADLRVSVCLGVGGLFDFLSGERTRAPIWMRRAGIEWMFRFMQDPLSKWKRVLVEIPEFILRIAFTWLVRTGNRQSWKSTRWSHG